MRLLGLDPGLRHTGWGVIDASGNRLVLCRRRRRRACRTTWRSPSGWPRSSARSPQCSSAIAPNEAAVEETFVNKNPASTLKLGLARGVVLLAPAERGIAVHEYSANHIKKSVVGVGHAEKTQVQMMVRRLLPGCRRRRIGRRRRARRRHLPRAPRGLRRAHLRSRRSGAMIAMLAGVIDEIGADRLVLDVERRGLSRLLLEPHAGARAAPRRAAAAPVETHVREDHIHLYGFAEESRAALVPPPQHGAGRGRAGSRSPCSARSRPMRSSPRSWRRTRPRLRAPTASARSWRSASSTN